MIRKARALLVVAIVLLGSTPLIWNAGYRHYRNLWVAEHGEEWVHEFLYFGSKWDVVAVVVLLLGISSAVAGAILWRRASLEK